MHQYYEEILRRIPEPPSWFDDAGVPRFDPFAPGDLANIYAREAALAEITCQACGTPFRVALTGAFADRGSSLGDMIRLNRVHYGDPPNIGCCAAGPTMNSQMRAILEYWSKDHEIAFGWRRDRIYEGPVGDVRLYPVDPLPEVLAAADGEPATVHVACPSTPSRYALLGRLAGTAVERGGRVLLVYPDGQTLMAPHSLEGHVPDADVGRWDKRRRVALVDIASVPKVDGDPYDWVVILAAAEPRHDRARAERAAAASLLSSGEIGRLRVELVLAHSAPMLGRPDVVIDGARIEAAR